MNILEVVVQPGLRLWQLDISNQEITELKMPDITPHPIKTNCWLIKAKPNTLYCQALNKKNADTKFGKFIINKLSRPKQA